MISSQELLEKEYPLKERDRVKEINLKGKQLE